MTVDMPARLWLKTLKERIVYPNLHGDSLWDCAAACRVCLRPRALRTRAAARTEEVEVER